MKTIPATLVILLTALASFHVGCAAPVGGESAENGDEALANNSPDAPERQLGDLLSNGYRCVFYGGSMLMCGKDGDATTWFCDQATGVCTTTPPKAVSSPPPVIIRRPVAAPVKATH